MMNDPLLNTTATDVPPAPPVARTARTTTRKKHPAVSARILAVGLSATALIGMTTGYTLSQKASAAQLAISESIVVNASQVKPIDAGVIASTSTSEVVYVPVPGVSAAKAGTPSVQVAAPTPAPTKQKSSGSN
jgi:hypothetical protein